MTNVLLVAGDSAFERRLNSLHGHRVVVLDQQRKELAAAVGESGAAFLPDIIFVGSGVPVDKALEYGRIVLEAYPEMTVVLVSEPDRGLIRTATKIGIRGVVRPTISDRELEGLVDRAVGERSPGKPVAGQSGPRQVAVVMSPKGGVGKTTVAANLAVGLSKIAPDDVVLVDLDLQFGDVGNILGVDAEYTVTDAFESAGQDTMLLKTLLAHHAAGFFVLCGSDSPAANDRVTGEQVRKLISQLSGHFRFVVVDTSAGILEESLAALEEATDAILVSTMDVSSIRAMRKEIDLLAELGLLPKRRHVVMNMADRKSGLTLHDVEKVIGVPVDISVPRSDLVLLAGNRGEPAISIRRRNQVRKPFNDLVARVEQLDFKHKAHRGVDAS